MRTNAKIETWVLWLGLTIGALIARPVVPILDTPPAKAGEPAARQSTPPGAVTTAVDQLVEQLRAQPQPAPAPPPRGEKHGLYLLEVASGAATLVADEPAPGLTHCGSARWAPDGRRIYFDATPGSQWNQAHLFAVEAGPTALKRTDLGPGNCPSPAPDGKLVAFMLNPGAIPDATAGVWIMNADGTGRRPVGSSGRPFWSPDGRQLLIVGFSDPCSLALHDVATTQTRPVRVDGARIYTIPSWVDSTTLVATLGTPTERKIALIDLTDPAAARVGSVLRAEDGKPSVVPAYPVVAPMSGRCCFVNANPRGMSLYVLDPPPGSRPRRLERDGFDHFIADLAIAPDGRYLLFCSDRVATANSAKLR